MTLSTYKLLHLDLPQIMEKILCNFLDNRTAQINIGNNFSNNIQLLSGVPQGSVGSPYYVFNIYE